jgi:class 3 adenylate cyclase
VAPRSRVTRHLPLLHLKLHQRLPRFVLGRNRKILRQTIDGERKTVTALFADIKGSMELMEDLDPEEARAIIDPALHLMIEAVRRYDGYVVQSTG